MAFGPDRKTMTRAQTQVADVDVGLRQYMLGVYNYMSLGVAFTGIVALVHSSIPVSFLSAVGEGWKVGRCRPPRTSPLRSG